MPGRLQNWRFPHLSSRYSSSSSFPRPSHPVSQNKSVNQFHTPPFPSPSFRPRPLLFPLRAEVSPPPFVSLFFVTGQAKRGREREDEKVKAKRRKNYSFAHLIEAGATCHFPPANLFFRKKVLNLFSPLFRGSIRYFHHIHFSAEKKRRKKPGG